MKSTKFTFFRRVTAFCADAALMLALLVLIVAATTAAAQTHVFVPGNASGNFGNPSDVPAQLVAALRVSGPGTITVTYVSGLVTWDGQGDTTGPNGTSACTDCDGMQFPLDEALGIGLRNSKHLGGPDRCLRSPIEGRKGGFQRVRWHQERDVGRRHAQWAFLHRYGQNLLGASRGNAFPGHQRHFSRRQ